MKKLITFATILLLCLAVLGGCTKNDDPEVNTLLYYNLDKGAQLTADANGAYTLRFLTGGEIKAYQVSDSALLEDLLISDFLGLKLNGNTITGIIRMPDMPYKRLAWDYYVQSIGSKNIKLNNLPTFNSKELLLDLPDDLPIYDVTATNTTPGTTTTLQKNDCVSIIADNDGALVCAYVTSRPAVPHQGKQYCSYCDSEVSWMDWTSTNSLPTSNGHYLLTDNVNLTSASTAGAGQICLDLNGKTVTQTTYGKRIYNIRNATILSIMDSVGTGIILPASTDGNYNLDRYGMTAYVDNFAAVVNLYSGTIDGTNCVTQYGHGIAVNDGTFNMYGGTILGGESFGPGSTCVSATGTFNMYGGKLVGGTCYTAEYVNPIGGVVFRVLGNTTIYGGEIVGGSTDTVGGIVRVSADIYGMGKLVIKGGSFTGGKAPVGGGIYVSRNSEVVVSGNPVINGNDVSDFYFAEGAKFSIGEEGLDENTRFGISAEAAQFVIENVPADMDLTKHIFSVDSAKKITKQSDGTWVLK